MARTFKGRYQAIDNMAPGGSTNIVTSQERVIAGAVPPVFTATWGNSENISVGVDYSADENIVKKATNLLATERRGA